MDFQNLMVIDPALEDPEIESFNEIVSRSPIKATYHLPAIHSSLSMYDQLVTSSAVILMGSAASVHEKHNWIKDITRVIEKAIEKKIPILGICFGHQLLAHLYGGKVDYLWDKEKKRGIRKVKTLDNNLYLDPKEDFLVYSHQEGVTIAPKDFEIFATSEMVEAEGIFHKKLPIWGFQPHIEASKTFAARVGVNSKDFKKTRRYSALLLESFFNKIKY
jgi:GMP synthase (glutamine-hydrolysing)